jgi:hypothetical protein
VVAGRASVRRRFFIVLDRASEPRHGYIHAWESAWRNLDDEVPPGVPVKRTETLLWESIGHFWLRRGKVRGFVVRIDRDGDRYGGFTPTLDAGWCGPTMMLAWLAIRRAIRRRRPELAEKAIEAADFFVRNAGAGNGAFSTRFNVRRMTWMDRTVNAVQMGGAAYWLLRCVRLLREKNKSIPGVDAEAWTAFALAFCDLAVRTQQRHGAFVARWTLKGEPLAVERAMGAHAARAVLEAYAHTGRRAYLDAAERGAEHLIRTCVDRETNYGDCTDLLNTTTENDGASVPDLFIDLYRVTGKARYLAKAIRSAEYCLAFTFAYNVYFPPETECGQRQMKTRGFGAISAETACVCWWFALQGNAFLELWKETGDKRWKEYAVAVIRASMQMMTRRGGTFGLADHLVGVRAEVIPVLDMVKGGEVWKKGMTGYTWHQPVWWPAAFNLLNFALIEDRHPEVKKEIET